MKDFDAKEVQIERNSIFVRVGGHGPPILLLHGFPQTHLMWRDVAPILARDFTVVTADLRGYGRSGCPPSTNDHSPYSKRAMAQEMVLVMERLGYSRFSVTGHNRGGRVAYRWRRCWKAPPAQVSERAGVAYLGQQQIVADIDRRRTHRRASALGISGGARQRKAAVRERSLTGWLQSRRDAKHA